MRCCYFKFIAILLIFTFSQLKTSCENANSFFNYIKFYSSSEFLIPLSEIEDARNNFILESEAKKKSSKSGYECNSLYDSIKLFSVKTVNGVDLNFTGIDFKLFSTMPSTKFENFISAYEQDKLTGFFNTVHKKNETLNYGIVFKTKDILENAYYKKNEENYFPDISLYLGNLAYSKSISLLKNPQLSSLSNALKTNFARLTGLGCSLPSSSTSEKPFSTALVFKNNFFNFECACFENSTFLFSTSVNYKHKNFFKTQISLSGGRFFLEQSKNTSYFSEKRNFISNWYEAYALEITTNIPRLKNQFSIGCHKNPFANFRFWIRNENRIIFGALLLDTAFFTSDNCFLPEKEGIIKADSGILQTVFQAKVNPQIIHNFKSIKLRTGFASAIETKQKSVLNAQSVTDLSFALATEISNATSSAEVTFKIEDFTYKTTNNAKNSNLKYSTSLLASHAFAEWKLAALASFKIEKEAGLSKKDEDFAVYAYFPKKFLSTVSVKVSKEHKKTSETQQTELATYLTHNTGKIRFKGKIAIKIKS